MSLLLTLKRLHCFGVSIVNLKQVNTGREVKDFMVDSFDPNDRKVLFNANVSLNISYVMRCAI